jgi:putative ABC transport system substrate-binding protein
MRRRKFIALFGGAAAAWPLAVRAQQNAMPVIGFLSGRSATESTGALIAFRQGLRELGLIDGENLTIAFRWAEGNYDRLPALAADLVGSNVSVIAAVGGPTSGLAAKRATSTIPIVFISATDPVKEGLVASLNRPGGNATGVNPLLTAMEGKRLGLLHDLVPSATVIAVLLNPAMPTFDSQLNDVQQAARTIHHQLQILHVSSGAEIGAAFEAAMSRHCDAMLVAGDPFMLSQRSQIVALATKHRIPAIYEAREYAAAGGLISYGTGLAEAYRQVGLYVGRILKGERPADLPVMQPTKFELVINMKTAKALGIEVPISMQMLADEVIE